MTPLQILLVEEDRIFQAIIAKIAEKNGFILKIAESAKEAFDLLQENEFGLILLNDDGLMGQQFVQAIRKQGSRFSRIPIIVTGQDGPGQAVRTLLLGANSFLQKPFSEKQLLAEIATLVL